MTGKSYFGEVTQKPGSMLTLTLDGRGLSKDCEGAALSPLWCAYSMLGSMLLALAFHCCKTTVKLASLCLNPCFSSGGAVGGDYRAFWN